MQVNAGNILTSLFSFDHATGMFMLIISVASELPSPVNDTPPLSVLRTLEGRPPMEDTDKIAGELVPKDL